MRSRSSRRQPTFARPERAGPRSGDRGHLLDDVREDHLAVRARRARPRRARARPARTRARARGRRRAPAPARAAARAVSRAARVGVLGVLRPAPATDVPHAGEPCAQGVALVRLLDHHRAAAHRRPPKLAFVYTSRVLKSRVRVPKWLTLSRPRAATTPHAGASRRRRRAWRSSTRPSAASSATATSATTMAGDRGRGGRRAEDGLPRVRDQGGAAAGAVAPAPARRRGRRPDPRTPVVPRRHRRARPRAPAAARRAQRAPGQGARREAHAT